MLGKKQVPFEVLGKVDFSALFLTLSNLSKNVCNIMFAENYNSNDSEDCAQFLLLFPRC